ncbi:MAG: carboxypeptidase regulatory-like domain-containing protein [Planctomycetes bacterium]|nr:carboxypeptidase regulatory-like domain-containing protein [Planctomycetota bacterium]
MNVRPVLLLAFGLVLAVLMLLWLGADPAAPTAVTDGPDAVAAATAAAATAAAPVATDLPVTAARELSAAPSGTLALPAGAATGYRGRVVTAQRRPVADVVVRLLRGSPDLIVDFVRDPFAPPVPVRIEAARAVTAADGTFALDGIAPAGLCMLRCEFAQPALVSPALRGGHGTTVPVQRSPAPGEIVDLGDIVLKTGSVLQGRVVDESARPVAGALVRAARLPPLPFAAVPIERLRPDGVIVAQGAVATGVLELPPWFAEVWSVLPIASTTTGADGGFELHSVDAGNNVVAVTAPAHGSLLRQGVDVPPAATVSLGELRLPAGCETEVVVVTADGKPVVEAEVVVAPQSLGPPLHVGERAGRTDAEGRVFVRGLPRGAAIAAARAHQRAAWIVGEPANADGQLRVVLPAVHTLTLTVTDAQGAIARRPRLRLHGGPANAGVVEFALLGMAPPLDLTDRLTVLEDGRQQIRDVPPGTWNVLATAPGHATTSVDLAVRGDVEQTIALRPARSLRVRTIDVTGAPVAAAAVYVFPRGGSRQQRIVEMPLLAGRTDADGRCTISDLPTDETRISAQHPLHGQVHAVVQAVPPELVLQFAVAGQIRGRLTDGGRPPAPGRWVVVLERRYDNAPRGAMPDVPLLCMPDLDGSFAFAALQPGKWRVTAQDSLTDVGTVAGALEYLGRRKRIYPWNKADVELLGGEIVDVRLDAMLETKDYTGPGAVITGTVTIDGTPAAGALVIGHSDQPDRNATSRVDGGGAFDLGHVPVGKLRVAVVPRDIAESRLLEYLFNHHFARDLVVVDGQPQQLAIDIVTGSVVGEVRDWNGKPVAGCRVVLHDRGGDGRSSSLRSERTDGRGQFQFVQMPSGVFEVRANKEDFGAAAQTGIVIAGGGTVGPLVLTLLPLATVRGRVQVSGLVKKGPLGISLVPANGEPVRGGGAADGAFELKNVPPGRYRVEIGVWGDRTRYQAGELQVVAPVTADVVLVPVAK